MSFAILIMSALAAVASMTVENFEGIVPEPAVVEVKQETVQGELILQFETMRTEDAVIRLKGVGMLPALEPDAHPKIRVFLDVPTSSVDDWTMIASGDAGFVARHPSAGLRAVLETPGDAFRVMNMDAGSTRIMQLSGDWNAHVPNLSERDRILLTLTALNACSPTWEECLTQAQQTCSNGVKSLTYRCDPETGEVECSFECHAAS